MITIKAAVSQEPIHTLVVEGHAGSVPVRQINGRNYVDVEALAQTLNGALSFQGNQIALTMPAGGNSATASARPEGATGFSPDFLRAGIEAMSTIREWRSALASAIENQYPLTQNGLTSHQAASMTNLRLAQAAAATDADQKAAQLIETEYQKMKQLSDKYVAKRKNMNYISPDALKNDPLDQSIVACGRSLGAMAASGQFNDDGSCH